MAIIVDVSHAMNRTLYMNKDELIENPRMIAHLLCAMLVSIANNFGASKSNPLVLAIDSRHNWRKDFYKDNKPSCPEYENMSYKGQRVKDNTLDWEKIYMTVDETIEALHLHSDFQVIQAEQAEADDILHIASKHYASKGQKVFIITSDKDIKQSIVFGQIEMYDPIKKIFIPELDIEKFKKIHIMIGDKGDNILAIRPRLGEKTAEKLYPELDMLLATTPDLREKWDFNKKLIDFDEIPDIIVDRIKEELEKPYLTYHCMNLLVRFQKLNLEQMSDKVGKFKLGDKVITTDLNTQPFLKKQNELFESSVLDNFFGED